MGVFKKIKARRAEKKARENINRDNPTQPTKRGYKQNGFDAGEGTGSHSSGPNKSGNDNYVSPQLVSSKKPTTTTKKSTTPVVEKKSVFDLEDEMYQRNLDKKNEAGAKAKAEVKAKAEATAVKKKEQNERNIAESKNTKVVNEDATSKSGVKTYYTQAQLKRKQNEYAKQNRSNRNAAIKAGATTYTMINKDGTKKKVGLSKPG